MSKKAKAILRQAIKLYRKEDGASETGSYRDALTDVLHLLDDECKFDIKDEDDLWSLKDNVYRNAFNFFIEECQSNELKKIYKIPKKKLPLYINHQWRFKGNREIFLSRLKGDTT